MTEMAKELTLEELRDRIKAAGVPIPEERLQMVRTLIGDALRPIRATDWRAEKLLEPAVTFDAASSDGGDHDRR